MAFLGNHPGFILVSYGLTVVVMALLFAWIVVGLLILINGSGPTVQLAYDAIALILSGPYIPAFAFYFVVGYLTYIPETGSGCWGRRSRGPAGSTSSSRSPRST